MVWQKGMALAKGIYGITRPFPDHEKSGIISQMRRAAVSIPSNIAEGQARHKTKEFIQFISHAEGLVAELEMQLMLAADLGYCGPRQAEQVEEAVRLISDLRSMLNALRRTLSRNDA